MVQYTITNTDLKLYDSYKVSKRNFKTELEAIRAKEPNYDVWNRGIPQMCLEWACHNAAYALKIRQEQAKDVDLDYPQPFWMRTIYAICGCLVWLFIK